ncbi:low molecular weight phosphotyrosine protein phosphatase [Sulfurovum sp. zt1-1]|uniref:protein-tyrosine-phosphatase n=1 Tax=Sulfurovum zhangzhouensis TaxID=3019067 RepID=A0ABT7QZB8_9BACT|nr:low molecular weight protein-tyrosine-phosphatase [Sulfurovum zhangzhouensis]MDM5271869.1 low molecular weight phosphotyrosine protein phosphatase [Sulfurovum zhangzhouensis]
MSSHKKVLFVCLGNICRSPLAEGVAQKHIDEYSLPLYVESAGTSNWHEGEAPCHNSIKVAQNNGIDISRQRSRPITKLDITSFDYVIAMDTQNQADLKAFGFEKVFRLGEFGGYKGADVPDPYFFKGFEGFEKVYEMVACCVEDILKQIKQQTL